MRRYAYEGVVLGGDRVQGEIQAVSLADARRLMLNKGVAVRRLRSLGSERASPKLSTEALARITRQVAVMLGAGLPLFEALNLVAEGARKDDELRVLKALANDVSAGKSISDALSAHPRTFDSLYRGLVTAGEQSGPSTACSCVSRKCSTVHSHCAGKFEKRSSIHALSWLWPRSSWR